MTQKVSIPSILVLKSIRTQQAAGGRLVSSRIDQAVATYSKYEPDIQRLIKLTPKGTLDYQEAKRALEKIKLLQISQKLASPDPNNRADAREDWAQRFTLASSRLYTVPRIDFLQQIVSEEVSFFTAGKNTSGQVADFYAKLEKGLSSKEAPATDKLERLRKDDFNNLRRVFLASNSDWFKHLRRHRRDFYKPKELKELFEELITIRLKADPRWKDWSVKLTPGKENVSVINSKRVISVGEQRTPASYRTALGLVAHELGVHIQRAINGADLDGRLARGYPGYINIEESLGVLAEWLATGEMPDKAKDRYLDIALAMGMVPGLQLSRAELMELALTRALARAEQEGGKITAELRELEKSRARANINRIFRGGDGLPGRVQAVFTKDAVYYPAVLDDYIVRHLDDGRPAQVVWEFLMLGKFDPTDPRHLKELEPALTARHSRLTAILKKSKP